MSQRKTIKVTYQKLGRSGAWGLSEGFGEIFVDEKLRGKKQFEIIIHEMLHELFPALEEKEVEQKAAIMTRTLWKEGFRKIDNHDKDKLQDE
ncbi:MAG: hypothetical protein JST87_05175 [Bacteroidetes bacterium]|nr:hypothetical protein [Bacteroidota bacterium]